jgi:hypothetical protein
MDSLTEDDAKECNSRLKGRRRELCYSHNPRKFLPEAIQ